MWFFHDGDNPYCAELVRPKAKKKSISGDNALRALSPCCVGSMCFGKEGGFRREVSEAQVPVVKLEMYLCCSSLDFPLENRENPSISRRSVQIRKHQPSSLLKNT